VTWRRRRGFTPAGRPAPGAERGRRPPGAPASAPGRPTTSGSTSWTLVLEASIQLAEGVGSPFTLSELIAEVQRRDPARRHGTISPVVQGMTANAGKGPESPCGRVFLRVGHGRYVLRDVANCRLRPPLRGGLRSLRPNSLAASFQGCHRHSGFL